MEFSLTSRIIGAFLVVCGAVIMSVFYKALVHIYEVLHEILEELRRK